MNTFASQSSVFKLIASQGLNAFGDHLAKIVASSLVAAVYAEKQASVWVGIISALYIVPYIVFAPLAGKLTVRFSKQSIVKVSLLAQALAMALLAISASQEWFAGVICALAIVAVQSCFLAPSRNSLLKEYAGIQKIGQAMGLLALVGVSATLVGLALGGWSFDYLWANLGNVWKATAVVGGVASGLAFLAFAVVAGLSDSGDRTESSGTSFSSVFKELIRNPAMRWSSLGLAWFYGVGAMLVMLLLQDGRWDHGQSVGAASQGGVLAALLGIGVALGSGIAAFVCRKRVELGLSFVGALGILVVTPVTAAFWNSDLISSVGIVLIGVFGGLFSAPLNATFVTLARDEARATFLAGNNLVINVVSGGFIGLGAALSYFEWSPAAQLYVIGASSLVVVIWMSCLIPESLIRIFVMAAVKAVYPVKRTGLENLPERGGALIVANHVSYLDAILIFVTARRPVRFVGTDKLLRYPWMRWMYRRFNVVAVSPLCAKDAICKTAQALKEGSVVCVFPEGALTRTGSTMPFKRGAELIARLAGTPVVPVWIDGLWGSMFSFADKPFRYRFGLPLRRRIGLFFGEPIRAGEATTQAMQDSVMKLGYE